MCNKLASRHVRVGLADPREVPHCDICENAPGDKPGHIEDLTTKAKDPVEHRRDHKMIMREKMKSHRLPADPSSDDSNDRDGNIDSKMIDLNTRPVRNHGQASTTQVCTGTGRYALRRETLHLLARKKKRPRAAIAHGRDIANTVPPVNAAAPIMPPRFHLDHLLSADSPSSDSTIAPKRSLKADMPYKAAPHSIEPLWKAQNDVVRRGSVQVGQH
ncbi:hypothetical protein B296_00042356 [Ensete ventricosum]|uniref:Uncharacterized protein n=1 Tax=Ensete ventricosum TaxID=4639 RepID=A0A426ZCM9_ENSVE|nr:hypothetical protein B296_00042356 [Ensete ventricosum]